MPPQKSKRYTYLLLERQSESAKEKEKEKKRDLASAGSLPKCLQELGLGQLEASISSKSPLEAAGTQYLSLHILPSKHISRKLDYKWEGWDLN